LGRVAQIPAPRAALATLVMAVVVTGVIVARIGSGSCPRAASPCVAGRVIQWTRPLPGSWVVQNGADGTTPVQGQAYLAADGGVAVIGFGATVSAYDVATGMTRWTEAVPGVPPGSAIVSVRAWDGVIAVGVAANGVSRAGVTQVPAVAGSRVAALGGRAGAAAMRQEIVLDAVTGKPIRAYPAARSGGTAWASRRRTVIVGDEAVASYANATGRAIWRDPTGPAGQAWRVADRKLYVTVSARGEMGTAPVTAVRQIDLRTGSERLIQRPHGTFDGTLTGVVDGVLIFSGSSGLSSYNAATGHLIARRQQAVLEGTDPVQRVLYADIAGVLTGINPVTLQDQAAEQRAAWRSGVYSVRAGVALGLDPGRSGAAWGYSIAKRSVIWTARPLPWPHYFADPSGLGGSLDQARGTALLVTCAATGQRAQGTLGGDAQACLRPMLVAIGPLGSAS
jgi:hypothetical protein